MENAVNVRLLTLQEVELAVCQLLESVGQSADDSVAREGFRLLVEDPELYNKWVYTAPDSRGRHRLFALSRRFCPFTNQKYAGASAYDPGLRDDREMIPTIEPCAAVLLGLAPGEIPEQLIRGSFGRDGSYSQNEYDMNELKRLVMERSFDPIRVDDARARIKWLGKAGPKWTYGNVSARFAGPSDTELVYQYQNCLNSDLRLAMDPETMRNGIRTSADYSRRHHFLANFNWGGFLLLEAEGKVIGCAWCYRSFDPMRAGWTVWVRHPYIDFPLRVQSETPSVKVEIAGEFGGKAPGNPAFRPASYCKHFYDAAIGFFAEAGFPTRVRTVAVPNSEWFKSLEKQTFHPLKDATDKFVYFYHNK